MKHITWDSRGNSRTINTIHCGDTRTSREDYLRSWCLPSDDKLFSLKRFFEDGGQFKPEQK